MPVAPKLLAADPVVAGWLILVAAVCYCAATLTAAFALWGMKSWARRAYAVFVFAVAAYIAIFLYLVRVPTPIAIAVVFFALLIGALYWGWRIVDRSFPIQSRAL